MKPSPHVPDTEEDFHIWSVLMNHWRCDTGGMGIVMSASYRGADRRDYELMRRYTYWSDRHYTPDMPAACFIPIAHMYLRCDPELCPENWHTIDLT